MRYLGADQDDDGSPRYWWTDGEAAFPLTVGEIQANGLTDKLREGIAAGRAWSPSVPAAPKEERGVPDVGRERAEGWDWTLFESDGVPFVAVSNRPSIDAAAERGERVPELQQAAVPLAVLRGALGALDA